MSTFQPGMASPGVPMFEADTDMITVVPTSPNLSYPDPIPIDPAPVLQYILVAAPPPSPDPLPPGPSQTITRIVSVVCSISASDIGDGKGTIIFRLGGMSQANLNDFEYVVPMNSFLQTDADPNSYLISFTGLVRTLPGSNLSLYVSEFPTSDRTIYSIEGLRCNIKQL